MFDLAGFALAAALGFVAAHLLRIVRNTAADSAQADAWRLEYENECKRHDLTLRQTEQREAIAAANIIQLSGALMNAAAQARKPAANVPPAMTLWLN